MTTRPRALVIGGGPAGLMAAEALSGAQCDVLLCEAKPSLGRKFLMAGKSGLNLTNNKPPKEFLAVYGDALKWMDPMLRDFDATAVQDWAQGLGQDLFTGSTGRVFPRAMKASPLLRAWLARLGTAGIQRRTRWRWSGWQDGISQFETPDGPQTVAADVTVLALGGASWSRLGSDGVWAPVLASHGVAVTPFAPANAGISVDWSAHMRPFMGAPIKGVAFHAGPARSRGEAAISTRGLEGGGVYEVSRDVRMGQSLFLDLLPDLTDQQVIGGLSRPRGKASLSNHLRKALRLGRIQLALLQEFGRPLPKDMSGLAMLIKRLPVRNAGLRPLDEAISTAGGVSRTALTDDLMLRAIPGVFCAGEMLDWEAPTGGYLLTACLATGRWAGRAAADWVHAQV